MILDRSRYQDVDGKFHEPEGLLEKAFTHGLQKTILNVKATTIFQTVSDMIGIPFLVFCQLGI